MPQRPAGKAEGQSTNLGSRWGRKNCSFRATEVNLQSRGSCSGQNPTDGWTESWEHHLRGIWSNLVGSWWSPQSPWHLGTILRRGWCRHVYHWLFRYASIDGGTERGAQAWSTLVLLYGTRRVFTASHCWRSFNLQIPVCNMVFFVVYLLAIWLNHSRFKASQSPGRGVSAGMSSVGIGQQRWPPLFKRRDWDWESASAARSAWVRIDFCFVLWIV